MFLPGSVICIKNQRSKVYTQHQKFGSRIQNLDWKFKMSKPSGLRNSSFDLSNKQKYFLDTFQEGFLWLKIQDEHTFRAKKAAFEKSTTPFLICIKNPKSQIQTQNPKFGPKIQNLNPEFGYVWIPTTQCSRGFCDGKFKMSTPSGLRNSSYQKSNNTFPNLHPNSKTQNPKFRPRIPNSDPKSKIWTQRARVRLHVNPNLSVGVSLTENSRWATLQGSEIAAFKKATTPFLICIQNSKSQIQTQNPKFRPKIQNLNPEFAYMWIPTSQ